MNLTPKQLRIFEFIKKFTAEHNYAPTLQEIAAAIGVSTITIFEHIKALEKKGVIIKRTHMARSVEVRSLKKAVKHYKGEIFEIIGEGKNPETNEAFIICKSVDAILVYPKNSFYTKVNVNGTEIDKFQEL